MQTSEDNRPTLRGTGTRYAVVYKTYVWDDFTERQARRCQAATAGGDFYISVDVSAGEVGEIPFPEVVRTSNAALLAEGWPNRVEHKSLLWWNADYPHYQFHKRQPAYDFYVFVEYDALFLGSWDEVIRELAREKVDFAAFPLRIPTAEWHWAQRHAATYAREEVDGCLMCISVQSHAALQTLGERRLEMAHQSVPYWPSAEVFLATEVRRAGLKSISLETFADARHFDWHPPLLEGEIAALHEPSFAHPVYDEQRFLHWALAHTATLAQLVNPREPVLRHLSRLPWRVALLPYLALVWRALRSSTEQRFKRLRFAREQQRSCL